MFLCTPVRLYLFLQRKDMVYALFCVIINHQTKEDNTVTIRYRDTMVQERIAIKDLKGLVLEKIG